MQCIQSMHLQTKLVKFVAYEVNTHILNKERCCGIILFFFGGGGGGGGKRGGERWPSVSTFYELKSNVSQKILTLNVNNDYIKLLLQSLMPIM